MMGFIIGALLFSGNGSGSYKNSSGGGPEFVLLYKESSCHTPVLVNMGTVLNISPWTENSVRIKTGDANYYYFHCENFKVLLKRAKKLQKEQQQEAEKK